jgi:hypothetical protein
MKQHKYKTSSANFFVYDKYIVTEPLQVIHVSKNEVEQLHNIVSKNFEGAFGLIENRLNKNSINPMAYQYAKELMPNFSAFALVVHSSLARENFRWEHKFIKGIKHEIFYSLEDAVEWMESVL